MSDDDLVAAIRPLLTCSPFHGEGHRKPRARLRFAGVHASRRADRFQALEPVRQAARERFGAFAKGAAAGLALRHDHGSR